MADMHGQNVQGCALIASPYLTDPNFLRSVVYILRHDEEGAIGLLLNRPLHTTIGELLEQLTEVPVENHAPVYCGGPVDGPLMMLEESADALGNRVVTVASEQSRILEVCCDCLATKMPKPRVENYRVFDGYSGWGAGQLEHELRGGGWMVWELPPEQVFGDPEKLWQAAVREIGREVLSGSIDPSRIPEDPAFN